MKPRQVAQRRRCGQHRHGSHRKPESMTNVDRNGGQGPTAPAGSGVPATQGDGADRNGEFVDLVVSTVAVPCGGEAVRIQGGPPAADAAPRGFEFLRQICGAPRRCMAGKRPSFGNRIHPESGLDGQEARTTPLPLAAAPAGAPAAPGALACRDGLPWEWESSHFAPGRTAQVNACTRTCCPASRLRHRTCGQHVRIDRHRFASDPMPAVLGLCAASGEARAGRAWRPHRVPCAADFYAARRPKTHRDRRGDGGRLGPYRRRRHRDQRGPWGPMEFHLLRARGLVALVLPKEYTIPPGKLLELGTEPGSWDARYWGLIHVEAVTATALPLR